MSKFDSIFSTLFDVKEENEHIKNSKKHKKKRKNKKSNVLIRTIKKKLKLHDENKKTPEDDFLQGATPVDTHQFPVSHEEQIQRDNLLNAANLSEFSFGADKKKNDDLNNEIDILLKNLAEKKSSIEKALYSIDKDWQKKDNLKFVAGMIYSQEMYSRDIDEYKALINDLKNQIDKSSLPKKNILKINDELNQHLNYLVNLKKKISYQKYQYKKPKKSSEPDKFLYQKGFLNKPPRKLSDDENIKKFALQYDNSIVDNDSFNDDIDYKILLSFENDIGYPVKLAHWLIKHHNKKAENISVEKINKVLKDLKKIPSIELFNKYFSKYNFFSGNKDFIENFKNIFDFLHNSEYTKNSKYTFLTYLNILKTYNNTLYAVMLKNFYEKNKKYLDKLNVGKLNHIQKLFSKDFQGSSYYFKNKKNYSAMKKMGLEYFPSSYMTKLSSGKISKDDKFIDDLKHFSKDKKLTVLLFAKNYFDNLKNDEIDILTKKMNHNYKISKNELKNAYFDVKKKIIIPEKISFYKTL